MKQQNTFSDITGTVKSIISHRFEVLLEISAEGALNRHSSMNIIVKGLLSKEGEYYFLSAPELKTRMVPVLIKFILKGFLGRPSSKMCHASKAVYIPSSQCRMLWKPDKLKIG